MATILVGASDEPRALVERILTGHELSCAATLVQAEQLLGERRFDLIFSTIAFDESRMFDFLRLAKSTSGWERIPFVCARVRAHILRSPMALEAIAFTARALGAAAFLDIANYQVAPEQEMREDVERLLDSNGDGNRDKAK